MEKKYIMAQINIPIEVLSDGQTRPHVRCAQIEFLPCDKLPPEHDNPNQFIMEKMSAWLGGDNNGQGAFTSPTTNSVGGRRPPEEFGDNTTKTITESKHIHEPEELLLSLFVSKEDIARTVKARGQTITFKNYSKAIRSRSLTEKNR